MTETQKETARVHKVPAAYLEMLWGQFDIKHVTKDGLVLNLRGDACKAGAVFKLPMLSNRFARAEGPSHNTALIA